MIPLELVRSYDAENQYYYDEQWNCLMLPDSQDAIRAWYNNIVPELRKNQVSEISIDFINNIEEFTQKRVMDYVTK